ncbi:hypothetical protein [Undibacterium sp. Ji49W]|uniref:hypothetical protein n=1 Tax=Undibacterium sp. Ji49W TaxID=3413040 RepID=UPI003BF30D1A
MINHTTETELTTASENNKVTDGKNLWILVSQVKSNRVVYFTDDVNYQPCMEGNWYFVTQYRGSLPAGMTLANCWSWRFNGHVFKHAGDKIAKPLHERLMESNRNALLALLKEKINLVRKNYAPQTTMGSLLRTQKLTEANAFIDDPNAESALELLKGVALARDISIHQAAELIKSKANETEQVLTVTEQIREKWRHSIKTAKTEAELISIREILISDVYPDLSTRFKFPATTFAPEDWDTPLQKIHKAHEIARLKTQLAEVLNKKRRSNGAQFLANEVLARHKTDLAKKYLMSNRENDNEDFSLLENYAKVHNLTVTDTAKMLVVQAQNFEKTLIQTEMVKDRIEARINSIKTMRNIQKLSIEITLLKND